jgi:hypothetical protein
MSIELTDGQGKALDAEADEPVRIIDPRTNRTYVLLSFDVYERIKALFEDAPVTKDEQRSILAAAGKRAGWDDPEMDIYNELDPRKS